MIAVHFFGPEINGARRWLSIAGHSIQPSEFAKPGFVVVSAWLFAESEQAPRHAGAAARHRRCRLLHRAAHLRARRRPDAARQRRVGDAVFSLRARRCSAPASSPCAAPGRRLRLLDVRARALSRRQVLRSDAGRQLADRSRHEVVLRGRLPRPRPGRGHHQDGAAGRAHRLHLRRRRRGVRHHRLPGAARPVRLRRHARARHRGAGEGCGDAAVDPGAGAAVRAAGADQHGRQRRAAAGQRHHAAVRFVGRIVDAGGIASRSACCWR